MSLWQQMSRFFVMPALEPLHRLMTPADVMSDMECESLWPEQIQTDLDTSKTAIQELLSIHPSAQSIIRCVWCHGTLVNEITCDCGAKYHLDCVPKKCVTLGCSSSFTPLFRSNYPYFL